MSDILQKVVDTTNVGSGNGGLLNTDQANRFIDYMFDATILALQLVQFACVLTQQTLIRLELVHD